MSAALVSFSSSLPPGPAAATIAFVLGSDVDGATVFDVLAATRAVCPAVVAGDRHVVGSPVPVPAADLRLLGIVLEHNGEVVATAAGAAADGHPAAAVAALVAAGEQLRAGDVVVTAPLASVAEVRAGDVLVASIGRVGSVEAVVG
jgi:2-oxo-3-hexenedioate decarboxylase